MTNEPNGAGERCRTTNNERRLTFFACYLLLVIVALLLRLAPLHRYVTPDEPAWVYRAVRFSDALAANDWTAIPSTGHPGATTMWLGSVGVAIQRLLTPEESTAHLERIRRLAWFTPENSEAIRHLSFFLPWSRVIVALTTTLGLALLYPLLIRLFEEPAIALLAVGLLAFDPFLIGHSGLLHTDALLATFSLLALMSAFNGLRGSRCTTWWALSGLFAGLALMTKTPALVLLPFITLLIAIGHLGHPPIADLRLQVQRLPRLIAHVLIFTLSTALTCLIVYPSFWANPSHPLDDLLSFANQQVEMAQRPIFFAGQITYAPGSLFYPAALLLRISPLVLIGLIAGTVSLLRLSSNRRLMFLLLLAFAVGFSVLMNAGAKKHDRYVLPALVSLIPAAALGIGALIDRHDHRLGRSTIPILALQILMALAFLRHPLTYANPLAGGPLVAKRVLSTDWGEGIGAATRWLNQRPDAEDLVVATSSVPSLAPLFRGHTVPLDQAHQADYLVRSSSPIPTTPAYPIAHTIILGLFDYDRVFVLTNTAPIEQAAYLTTHTATDDVIVLTVDTPLVRRYTGPGTIISLAHLPHQPAIAEHLAETIVPPAHLWLVEDPAASPLTVKHLHQTLDTIAVRISTTTITSATISQYTVHRKPIPNLQPQTFSFEDHLTLVDVLLPSTPVSTSFPVHLRWQVPAPTPTDLHATLHLRDQAGHFWSEVGQLILNQITFPTTAWRPSEWADDTVKIKLPPRLPPDTYTVQLTITDAEGAQLGVWNADGQFQGVRLPLGTVDVAPPAQPIGKASCLEGHLRAAGSFEVCIPDLAQWTIPSGDTIAPTLIWSATAPPKRDYEVRWRLVASDGAVALETVTPLSPYPTPYWRKGDSFESRYDLYVTPTLPADQHTLALNVLAADDEPIWPQDEPLATVEVLSRDRQFELPDDIAHPLDLILGDIVHLRGFDLDRTHATPGGTLPLTLYWQAEGPTKLDYTVFVHLVGPDGHTHGQVDQFPGAGSAPTTSWAPGQVVVDRITLPISADAPADTYHVAVGMYHATSGGRLPIVDTASGPHPLPNDQFVLPTEITIAGGSR